MIKNTTRNQKLGWVLFVSYLILLVYFMFFAESFGRAGRQTEYAYNLELFREIKRFYRYRNSPEILGMKAFLLNVVGNVVGFMPFGFFLPIVSRRGKRWYNLILITWGFSFCIELTQLIWMVGSFDVDDMLLNTMGGVEGFILYQIVQFIRSRRRLRG